MAVCSLQLHGPVALPIMARSCPAVRYTLPACSRELVPNLVRSALFFVLRCWAPRH